jgi:hypothetical protein
VSLLIILFILATESEAKCAQQHAVSHGGCKIQSTIYEGWPTQQLSNRRLKLTIVPQLGGRIVQAIFVAHNDYSHSILTGSPAKRPPKPWSFL